MSGRVSHFVLNDRGRDFCVGDIHGHFSRLAMMLQRIGFDHEHDRLFSVGDLVDRGPESEQVLEWIGRPWFHAVRGNHEEMAIRWAAGDRSFEQHYADWGGAWMMNLPAARQKIFATAFDRLPYAIDVDTHQGLIGIVHAEVWGRSWQGMVDALTLASNSADLRRIAQQALWTTYRIETNWQDPVEGVHAVVAGHATVDHIRQFGNAYYIDTGGWRDGGEFTVVDLTTLNRTQPTALDER